MKGFKSFAKIVLFLTMVSLIFDIVSFSASHIFGVPQIHVYVSMLTGVVALLLYYDLTGSGNNVC